MKSSKTFQRAAALLAAVSMSLSMPVSAFAGTYYIDYGDITITKNEDGSQTITQGNESWTDKAGEETIITTTSQAISTMEETGENHPVADIVLEPVDAEPEESQPEESPEDKAEEQEQPEENLDGEENTEENTEPEEPAEEPEKGEENLPEDAAQPEIATLESNDATAPVDTQANNKQPVNDLGNGFFSNVITIINNFKDTVANVTIRDVKIDGLVRVGKAPMTIQGDGDVALELDGENVLKGGHYYHAGLEKNDSESKGNLIINDKDGNGSLTATSYSGAGIGGSNSNSGSNISINGGTIIANGSRDAAGIGGGSNGSGSNITINGGNVTATGNTGIGGGGLGTGGCDGSNITINGGTVNATGGSGAGIGGGYGGDGSNITINGGNVTAKSDFTSGIGGGAATGNIGGNGNNITINGGTVIAVGGNYGAGIGGGTGQFGGSGGVGSDITITGGTVTATGGKYGGAGIGGSAGVYGGTGEGSNITITGGKVTATGGSSDDPNYSAGAGIGGGAGGDGSNITISGGAVIATGGVAGINGAGIGGGANANGSNVTVSKDAEVTVITKQPAKETYESGATIGNGGGFNSPMSPSDAGKEIQSDISGLYTNGYIHHIIYKADGTTIEKEWWERGTIPAPEPDELTGETATLPLHVENLFGTELAYTSARDGGTLTLTVNDAFARLHGSLAAVRELQAQGVNTIVFVTSMQTTTVSVSDLLARGADGDEFALRHDGVLSTLAVGNEILPAPCAK